MIGFLFLLANMVTMGMEISDTFGSPTRECSARTLCVLCAKRAKQLRLLYIQYSSSVLYQCALDDGDKPHQHLVLPVCVCARLLDRHPFGFRRLSWWSAAWGVEVWCHQIDVIRLLCWSQDLGYPTNLKSCFKFWFLWFPKLRMRIKCSLSFLVCHCM